jgi:Fe-S cluster biosynthesis and repair protein YggX
MLRNWKYTGIYVYCRKGKDGKPLNQKKYRTLVKEQPEMRNMGTVLNAIVSQDLFDKVQKIVDERELKCPKQNRHAEYLLSGLVHCECGKNMYGETSKSANKTYQYRYYVCPNQRNKEGCKTQKINADYLEQAIKELLLREINTYLQQNKIDKKQLETIRDKFSSLLGELNRNISTLERSNAKYLNCITEANKLMVTEYEKKITDNLSAITCLNTKAQQTKETITAIQQVIDGQVTLKFTPEQLFSDTAITRQLIRAFIDNITIKENGQIIINLK